MGDNNILIGVGFIVLGVIMILINLRKNRKCSGRTIGRITGIHEDMETDSDGFNTYSYSPEYEYEVNGQIYRGSGGRAYSKRDKIQIGGNIQVFYNPNKPEEHSNKGNKNILLILGVLLIAFGIFLIYLMLNG